MATSGVDKESGSEQLLSARRTLAVLEALAARPDGATPKELSQALGLHLSTCYRLLNSLAAAGYATRCSAGLFRLGARVAYLHHGYLAALRPPAEAIPFVHALQLATGETAVLNQLEGDDVVTTAAVMGSRPAAIPVGYIGAAAPAHALATGRVLLASLPPAERDAYLTRLGATPESPFAFANPDALRGELERICHDGYALDHGHGHSGICCVAAPVSDRGGVTVAAIATVVPCGRFGQGQPALVAAVRAVTNAIDLVQAAPAPREDRAEGGAQESHAIVQAALTMVNAAMSRVG